MRFDHNSSIPLSRQALWQVWQQQVAPLDWEEEGFEEDDDEGIDFGCKH